MRLAVAGLFCAGFGAGCCPGQDSVESPPSEETIHPDSGDASTKLFDSLMYASDGLTDEFEAGECLELARYIQSLPAEQQYRADPLMEYALEPEQAHYVYAMCRMLFDRGDAPEIRRPLLGDPVFVDQGEWPLDPITLENGVPFVVVTGWSIAGAPELPHQYALHCLLNYKWTTSPIEEKTDEGIRERQSR